MTNDKLPREWLIDQVINPTDIQFSCISAREKTKQFCDAYDSLAQNLKETETKLLNTKELSSKLVEENERLKDTPGGKRLYLTFNELARERELSAKLKAHAEKLAESLESAASELSAYSQGERDKSFDGWQLTWREVPIKHESDYAFYPNHVTKEAVADLRQPIAEYRKEFKK